MAPAYVVVDGSNIATEGRSIPSLAQLDEAVRAFMAERPAEQVIVVVDASFGYRIDESERREYEQAEEAGEIVSPPAGALGRGDGFLLRIADRTGAVVLSNDSFQEFHGEYPWLFDAGRLIGGKPVPGVGWIFTLRTPVRGPRSREATRAADKAKRAALKRAKVAEGPLADAIAEATAEVIDPSEEEAVIPDAAEPGKSAGRKVRRRRTKPAGTVNDPLPFIEFIAEHPLGSEVEGEVEAFTSHGAFVLAAGARCYVPLVALGDPPPRSAKEVFTRGQRHTFVVQALDPPRRGIELALPGMARVAGVPTEETVEADIGAGRKKRAAARSGSAAKAELEAPVPPKLEPAAAEAPGAAEPPAPARRTRKRRAAPERAPAAAETGPAIEPLPAPAPPLPPPVPETTPPARRSSRSRTKAAEPVQAAATSADAPPAAPVEAASATPAPVATGRPRRKRVEAAAPAAASPAPEPAPATDGPAPAAPAPERARRSPARTGARTATAETNPEPEQPPAPAAPRAPTTRTRSRTRKEAAPGAGTPTPGSVSAEPPAPVAPVPVQEPVKKATKKAAKTAVKKAAKTAAKTAAKKPGTAAKAAARRNSAGG